MVDRKEAMAFGVAGFSRLSQAVESQEGVAWKGQREGQQ